jgi:predicted nuclease of restriction endonuclease-like RecB superfamily
MTPRPLSLLIDDDLPWVGALTDVVVRSAGQPWRTALDQIEAGAWMPDARVIPARRLAAAVNALRRLLGGRAYRASLARRARELVLGVPTLTDDARDTRLAAAAVVLGLSSREVDQLLWADLPSERPIALPTGRPPSLEVAALANVALVQRALRRAHSVELRVTGDAGPLLRAAAARGLLATSSRVGETTMLEIIGPLALCHGTTVYGRAIGTLVPLLGACSEFELTIHAEAKGQRYQLVSRSPALLAVGAPPKPWRVIADLARDLEARGHIVERAPPPVAAGPALVCPDLRVRRGTRAIAVEVVGFWTPEFLARKLARYQAVGLPDVILCIDATRACDDEDDPPPGACVVRFERRINAGALAQLLG